MLSVPNAIRKMRISLFILYVLMGLDAVCMDNAFETWVFYDYVLSVHLIGVYPGEVAGELGLRHIVTFFSQSQTQ